MNEISQSDFATSIKVSRACISLGIKRGILKITESGKIDLDDNNTIMYLKKRETKSDKSLIKPKKQKLIKIKPEKVIKIKPSIEPVQKKVIAEQPIKEHHVEKQQVEIITIPSILDRKIERTKVKKDDDIEKVTFDQYTPIDEVIELQEFFKAQKYKEEVLAKQLQRQQTQKELIDIDMAKFLFFSFMDQMKTELAILPHKQTPNLESLYKSNQSAKAESLMLREYEAVIERIIIDQKKALEKWKKDKD